MLVPFDDIVVFIYSQMVILMAKVEQETSNSTIKVLRKGKNKLYTFGFLVRLKSTHAEAVLMLSD